MLIDTHAHLNFKAFKKDLDDVINRAKESGIEKIIIPGAKINSSKKAIEISQKYASCFAAVGIHPHHAYEYTSLLDSKEVRSARDNLESLVRERKVVAVGEIGLDYHEYKDYPPISEENKKQQKELLILQINLAQETNLPIIFHCRNAYDDQLEIITHYSKSTVKQIIGVFHCFSGEKNHLEKILSLGFYIGFDGNITYRENSILQDLVKYTPLDRLLLETDSPFLAPIKHRGSRNEPSYLPLIVSFIASLHKKKISQISEITSGSALKLFNL